MAIITAEERQLIDNKIKEFNCPLCGGQMRHFVEPFQLICLRKESEIKKNSLYDYLCGECQSCGYTILRRLDILLGRPSSHDL